MPHLPVDRASGARATRAKAYDPNVDATRQEKRSFVCGQCHVEYFCGKGQTIFFPWAEGLKVEQMQKQYDATMVKGARFKDWVHAETGMEVLKAQHPEFELWSRASTPGAASPAPTATCRTSARARRRSPSTGCGARCSSRTARAPAATRYSDDELKARVARIQDRHFDPHDPHRPGQRRDDRRDRRRPEAYDERNRAAATAKAKETLEKQEAFQKAPKEEQEKKLDAEVKANLLAAWRDAIAKDPKLKELEELQRAAQWRLDFVAAENSMGFHAPQETGPHPRRVDRSRAAGRGEGRAARRRHGRRAGRAAGPGDPGRSDEGEVSASGPRHAATPTARSGRYRGGRFAFRRRGPCPFG